MLSYDFEMMSRISLSYLLSVQSAIHSYYNTTAIDYEFITCKPSYQDFCARKVYFCLGEDTQYSGCLAQDDIGANSIEHELAPLAVIQF